MVSLDWGNILTGSATFILSVTGLLNILNKRKKDTIGELQISCKGMKEDLAVIKDATYHALNGVVELGANGETKKSRDRLKENIFKE